MSIKIGVVSDTHIPVRSKKIPQKILEAFKKVDMVIHVGDLVDLSVLDELRAVCKDVKAVWGNMDPEDARKKLPEKIILNIGKFKFGVTHGFGSPAKLTEVLGPVFKDEEVDAIIFGHSHTATNETRDGVLFFNPGSPTDKLFAPYNSYGIIEVNDKIDAKIIKI